MSCSAWTQTPTHTHKHRAIQIVTIISVLIIECSALVACSLTPTSSLPALHRRWKILTAGSHFRWL
uniref:LP04693p n=1 Tax=Drosophila melanogaster TaxID=7227 RepID=Q8MS86_DROME|nr:LP04693p [Drosophila melanogaster]